MARYASLWLAVSISLLFAQTQDDFSDGNFTSNPPWTGTTAFWTVNTAGQLQSNGTGTDTLYLSTPFAAALNGTATEWRVRISLGFAPSDNNFCKFYLASDQADLTAALNGYFIRIGENGAADGVDLFRQDGAAATKLIDGTAGTATSGGSFFLKITRSGTGDWEIFREASGAWISDGTATDLTHGQSQHLGAWVRHTSTNATKFTFDDVYAGGIVTDQQPPQLTGVSILNANQIQALFSEKPESLSAETPANYGLSPTLAVAAAQLTPDSAGVTLTLAQPMANFTSYTLSVVNVADRQGNAIPSDTPQTRSFLYFIPDTAEANDVIINELMADPSPVVMLPDAEWVELYNRSQKYFDLSGWKLGGATLPSVVLKPGDYLVLCAAADTAALSVFGRTAATLTAFNSLSNSGEAYALRSKENVLIDSLFYAPSWYKDPARADGGWTLERINPNPQTCPVTANWRASVAAAGGTPGAQNSVYSLVPDLQAPGLTGATLLTNDTLLLTFSESMDPISLSESSYYAFTPALTGSPLALPQGPDFRQVKLVMPAILPGVLYTIHAQQVTDCSGNLIGTQDSAVFVQPGVPALNDVIVNEIMADPSPQVLLPNAEWVELYNRSQQYFDLSGWKLGGAVLPPVVLEPGGFVLVCAAADTAKLAGFGKAVAPLTAFNSLTNTGEGYSLRSKENLLIDSLFYAISWYRDDAKADGGWSLERINPNPQSCPAAANWTAAMTVQGGTPGAPNSVYSLLPDTLAPTLLSADLLAGDTLQLTFSKSMDAASLAVLTHYTFTPTLPVPLKALPQGPDFTEVRLKLSQIADGTIYTLHTQGLIDCSGNPLSPADSARFARAALPGPGELVINEVFPDPTPARGLPGGEFVEIHNPGTRALSLTGSMITDGSTTALLPATVLFPGEFLVLCPADYKANYAPYGRVYAVSLPSLNNESDSLTLIGPGAQILDFVAYSLNWYGNLAAEEGGITLERRDASQTGCNLSGNWGASADPSGGTPGRANSLAGPYADTAPPSLQGVGIPDAQTISLTFSEGMAALEPDRFVLNPGGLVPLGIAFAAFSPVRFALTFDSALDSSTLYTLVLDSVTDCSGNRLDTVIQLGFPVQPTVGDLVINELLFNPYSGGSDFVEVYNASNQVFDLGALLLANTDPATGQMNQVMGPAASQILLLPGEYAAVTEDRANLMATYNPPPSARIFEVADLPSFGDTEGGCILMRGDSLVLDRFDYLDDYHYPTLTAKDGISLERISFLAPSSNPTNWHSAASTAGYATPGYANSQHDTGDTLTAEVYAGYTTFTPDGDGTQDALPVRMRFSEPGSNVRLRVSDSHGQIVRTIGGQWLLGTATETIYWDGTGDSGQRLPIGIYVVIAERMRPDGKTVTYRVPCVLGGRL